MRDLIRQAGVVRLLATFLVLACAVAYARYSWSIPLVVEIERALYDIRATAAAPRAAQDNRIVMVTYTETTLAQTSRRSPVDRSLLADALVQIDALGPRAIGIDILVDQPLPAEDARLIEAFRRLRTPTYLAFTTSEANAEFMQPWQEAFLRDFFKRVGPSTLRPASIRLEADVDGTIRSWPFEQAGEPPLLAKRLAGPPDALDGYRRSIVFRQPLNPERPLFDKVSIELLANPATAVFVRPLIEGRIVMLGADLTVDDRHPTPFTFVTGATTAGLEVHAHLVAQALDRARPKAVPGWMLWTTALLAVTIGALTSWVDLRLASQFALMLVQVAAMLALPVAVHLGGEYDTQSLPMFGWIAGWLIAYLAAGAAARTVGAEQRRFAQSALGKYLPPDVAQQIIRNPDQLALRGERKPIYALFTDMEGFTKLSHALEPEQIAALLNAYLDRLSDIVLEHGGTLDKFVGDAVVAFWGAPIARADDGERAVAAAIAMGEAGKAFIGGGDGSVPLMGRTRVGLHRGEAVVGNFGGEGRIQYTALGDAMNAAARLEGANKKLGSTVLVSSAVVERVPGDAYLSLGRVVLRGRATPIAVYEPRPDLGRQEVARLNALVARFDRGDADAIEEIEAASALRPDDATLVALVYRLRSVGPGGSYGLD